MVLLLLFRFHVQIQMESFAFIHGYQSFLFGFSYFACVSKAQTCVVLTVLRQGMMLRSSDYFLNNLRLT